jgi:Uma2 family endonuclease
MLGSMSAALKQSHLSVADYLAGELTSDVKHEYLGGAVYAMAGAANTHNLVAVNIISGFRQRLRGHQCRTFNSDTKLRIKLPTHLRFYYPDAMVVCRLNPGHETFQDEPSIVVEVLSPATRRIDEGEKREAYVTIPSLEAYLLVETGEARVTVWRRGESGFVPEVHSGMSGVIHFPWLGIELPLAEIYEDIVFGGPSLREGEE